MPVIKRKSLRRIYALLVALAGLGMLFTLLQVAGASASFWDQLDSLPLPMRLLLMSGIFAVVLLTGVLMMRALNPPVKPVRRTESESRPVIEARIVALGEAGGLQAPMPVQQVVQELAMLDQRATGTLRYIAVFGDVSAGKSSLLNTLFGALLGAAARADVRAGTTREVSVHELVWHGQPLAVADVPGVNERDGVTRAVHAREEALRCHLVLYVLDADLTRSQLEELTWLKQFDKPMLVILSKIDRYAEAERQLLLRSIRQRTRLQVLPVSAGHVSEVEVVHPDGRVERQQRQRKPDVETVVAALKLFLAEQRAPAEARRVKAVLRSVDLKLEAVEKQQRAAAAERVVQNGSRNAVIGAMASVAPGSDLVIQSVLAMKMLRELAALYGVPVRDVDLERLLKLAGGKLRASSSILLALAGNVLKAFPGLGTVGGGLLHAVAYGMVFHSLGHAVSEAMAQRRDLDRDQVLDGFARRLSDRDLLLRLAPQFLQWAIKRTASTERVSD